MNKFRSKSLFENRNDTPAVDEEETIHGFIENRTVFGKPSSGCPEQFRIINGHMFRNI